MEVQATLGRPAAGERAAGTAESISRSGAREKGAPGRGEFAAPVSPWATRPAPDRFGQLCTADRGADATTHGPSDAAAPATTAVGCESEGCPNTQQFE